MVGRDELDVHRQNVIIRFSGAKLRKKVVTGNGFWKINAIRPKIKAKRGRTKKGKKEGNAKLGGLVKESSF